MKKIKLLSLSTLIFSLFTSHFSLAEDIFDSEIEKEIKQEGKNREKEAIEKAQEELRIKKEEEERKKQEQNLKKKKEIENKSKVIKNKKTNIDISMIKVEGGTFQMGSNDGESDEKPVHSVTVDSFYIGKYEVTVEEYRKFVNETGRNTSGCYYWTGSKWELDSNKNYSNPGFNQGESNPVSCVSWEDAKAYCNWLSKKKGLTEAYDSSGNIVNWKSYRLPTEAEWEYAAKGGNKSRRYKYSGSNNIDEVAWYDSNSSSKTHSVGTKASNELGIYDMSGNVWELVSDWYDDKYYNNSTTINPYNNKSASYRVLRGGSWYFYASIARVSDRGNDSPTIRFSNLGFRLSRTVP